MLKSVLLIATVIAGSVVLADNCGVNPPVSLQEKYGAKLSPKGGLSSMICPLCVDLVAIAETALECGEGIMEGRLDAKCQAIENSLLKTICLKIVTDLIEEIEEDTEKDPNKMCTKITHTNCNDN